MTHFLAESTGMKNWSVAEWSLFITAVVGGLTTLIAAISALRKSDRAETNSANANQNASAARTSADHAGNIAAEARGATKGMPTVLVTPSATPPPVASPEAQARAFDAANESEKPPSC